jgi:hypothetical protein
LSSIIRSLMAFRSLPSPSNALNLLRYSSFDSLVSFLIILNTS